MRRKINLELKQYLIDNANKYTVKELVLKVNKKFNENYKENELRKYLVRNKINYKYQNKNMSHHMGKNIPIGSEYIKPDGMVMIKTARNKWEYKQRYIYEKHYGVKLRDDEFIIFLNQNRNDFRIENLRKVTRKESAYLSNMDIFSKNARVTELAIGLAQMTIKIKEIEKSMLGE